MTKWDKFNENLDKIEELYLTEYDFILAAFLSNELILKRLIKESSPGITDEQVDLITEPEEVLLKKEEEKIELEEEIEDEEQLDPSIREQRRERRRERREKRKEEFKEKVREIKKIWKNRLVKMLDEIKKRVRELKKSIIDLIENAKTLAKKLVTSATLIANSIPSIAITITTPPWNIPKAIVDIALILTVYFDIILLLKVGASLMAPLRDLPLYIDPEKLSGLASVLNVYLIGVIAAWEPVMFLKRIITNLIKEIKKFLFENKGRIFRKATRRLRKLNYLPGASLENVDEDDLDEVEELLERFVTNNRRVTGFREDFDKSFDEFESEIENEITVDIDIESPEFESFVYEVELPDGTIITSINEEGIKYFKEKYKFTIVDVE